MSLETWKLLKKPYQIQVSEIIHWMGLPTDCGDYRRKGSKYEDRSTKNIQREEYREKLF